MNGKISTDRKGLINTRVGFDDETECANYFEMCYEKNHTSEKEDSAVNDKDYAMHFPIMFLLCLGTRIRKIY